MLVPGNAVERIVPANGAKSMGNGTVSAWAKGPPWHPLVCRHLVQ